MSMQQATGRRQRFRISKDNFKKKGPRNAKSCYDQNARSGAWTPPRTAPENIYKSTLSHLIMLLILDSRLGKLEIENKGATSRGAP